MQSLVLQSLSTQFGHFNPGESRPKRSWSPNARGCSPRAHLRSMSESPPASEKPRGQVVDPPESGPSELPRLSGYADGLYTGSPRPLPGAQYPLAVLDPTHPGARSLAQKSTRRTKAHVASACVNCKKKHLGCDPARPCRRCVLSGKAKRGRPPLKAEDSSLRSYTTHLENPAIPAEAQQMPPRRTAMHRATSSRELRPMTDLQGLDASAGVRTPHRWSASVFPLTRPMDPSPTMPVSSRRPFSSSGPASHPVPTHPHAPYAPMAGFNPALKAHTIPTTMDRRFPPYSGVPALPPPTSPPQAPPVGTPFLGYPEPSTAIRPPMSDPRVPLSPRDPYQVDSPVRLPPIHQATAGPPPHHVHRLSDPYPASWGLPREDSYDSRSAFHRSAGPAFNYTFPHQRSSSITSATMDPVPRHLGPVELPSPIQVTAGSSPSLPRTEPPETETHDRPVKRRKMALDDMVNG
ncbi:unnamed protein product [Penicillium olsonii]|uniref:Zn(2)-C6 fungal-type domain-containing protein n=1 Tax=Penicillium olsonii TaxID=99116 RepID=A0A9W4H974_PENOL|nr:unnamed protein product [Penicillium olsonii]CAG7936503.1 unnamed protein product [Penicillium olsonii]CAG8194870.1 unnamed protein product [Penicillium olsonii]CAG8273394.1 unnamed protein product [Penicillium olsonii]